MEIFSNILDNQLIKEDDDLYKILECNEYSTEQQISTEYHKKSF